jgi:diguanylate cyclase (GGDEF)-like protein
MIDVDFFKKYNDRYGHIAGDECLKKVASVLREGAQRAGDFAGRYGGEEFLAILPGLSTGEAVAWAERLRTAVEGACIPHEDSQTGCVTVSIGVSSLTPTATGTMLELIRLADEALYRAKANGRNRVEPAPAH